jgi:hypothetical protein
MPRVTGLSHALVQDRDETDLRNRPLDLNQSLDGILRQAGMTRHSVAR